VPRADPPRFRAQIGATGDSAARLVAAHVELAKAELGEVLEEVKRVSVLGGIAIGAAIAVGLLVTVGTPLFLGEWIFGSMGWGLLHGLLVLAAVAVAAITMALDGGPAAVRRGFAIGLIAGVLVGLVLGAGLTNSAWALVGDSLLPLSDPGPRPLAAALVVLPVAAAVLIGLISLVQALRRRAAEAGLRAPTAGERVPVALPTAIYVGWLSAFIYSYGTRLVWPEPEIIGVGVGGFVASLVILVLLSGWRPGHALTTGLAIGTVLGTFLAVLTALALGPRVSAAVGLAVGLAVFIAVVGADVARRGVDGEELMKRFIPQKTIDMTKETIEWAQKRMPLLRRS
jgi:hypothetical protein